MLLFRLSELCWLRKCILLSSVLFYVKGEEWKVMYAGSDIAVCGFFAEKNLTSSLFFLFGQFFKISCFFDKKIWSFFICDEFTAVAENRQFILFFSNFINFSFKFNNLIISSLQHFPHLTIS